MRGSGLGRAGKSTLLLLTPDNTDETEGKHDFSLANYGEKGLQEDGQWVMLAFH